MWGGRRGSREVLAVMNGLGLNSFCIRRKAVAGVRVFRILSRGQHYPEHPKDALYNVLMMIWVLAATASVQSFPMAVFSPGLSVCCVL